MADNAVIGKAGRVTGRIAPGEVGAVVIAIRGGTEEFFAYGCRDGQVIEKGARVVVVDYDPPRTVYVDLYE